MKIKIQMKGVWRIPTGFRLKAQGREDRATLGHRLEMNPYPNGVVSFNAISAIQPRWGCFRFWLRTQGSSFLATLGCMTQSLWDWRNPADKIQTTALDHARHTSYVIQVLFLIPFLASAQATNDIPPLQPALPEIPPTLWEQHNVLIVVSGVLVLALLAAALWWLLQPKPAMPVAIEIQTRRELESLRQHVEDGRTLSEITRCLHRYIVFAFGLPPLELTTREFCRTILTNEKIGPELSSHFAEFLLRCDERKFAPSDGPPLTGTAERALQLLELGETRRARIRQAAVGQTAQPA